jgi:hypothetical protein
MSSCPKVPGAFGAVGYWGRDLRCRISQEQTIPKMRALLQDQLLGAGIQVDLWMSVHDVREGEVAAPGTLLCSCVKASGKHADRRCRSCHGINYVPGYRKFGYETLWVSSISPGLTLVNVSLNTAIKPHRYELASTAVTGTIETGDLYFTRLYTDTYWEYRNDYVVKDGTAASVTAHFSTDGGATWQPVENLVSINPGTGRIRFRITLTRNTTNDSSPMWEIFRARFPTVPVVGRTGPWILILKNVPQQKDINDMRGLQQDASPNAFWTAPLSLFDCNISTQSNIGTTLLPDDMLRDPAFIEFREGALAAGPVPQRWALTNYTYSDPMGFLIRQFFQARKAQQEEFTSLVW